VANGLGFLNEWDTLLVMRLHRFYAGGLTTKWGKVVLEKNFWVHDERLLNQWLRVLRFRVGDELVLFDDSVERLYKITKIEVPDSVHLELVTEMERELPKNHVYLFWSLLKKDKNDWVLQKATELGVRNFVPIVADRSEKTGFDVERAHKIVIEAAEQCGRADIPEVREPITIDEAVSEYAELPLFICEQAEDEPKLELEKAGVLIGPEGGWSDRGKELFKNAKLQHINIAQFTLRAETAAVAAATRLLT
jgi:16S rRNA (uracil1498-N3)-methyltransferase